MSPKPGEKRERKRKGVVMKKDAYQKAGFTLVEIIVATAVFLMAVVGILYSYAKCLELSEIGRTSTIALQAVKNKLEEIKAADFSTVHGTYDGTTFTAPGLNGIGKVYVDNSNAKLLVVKAVFCWRLADGRVVGEDRNLNGVLDAGEDKNGNQEIDSFVEVLTQIYG
jgi:prepilin-type N-terminal cleavage/methylation domain-containing protein